MKTYVKMTGTMGRGVFASQYIYPDETIEVCEVLTLSEQDTKSLESTLLKTYKYIYDKVSDCLVLGNGCIYNHSSKPNARYELRLVDGRTCMVYIANCLIIPNQQVFVDYKQDADVNLKDYGID